MTEVFLITDTVNGYAWVGSGQQVLEYLVGNEELENVNLSRWEFDEATGEWDQMTS